MVWADADISCHDWFIPDKGWCTAGSSCPLLKQRCFPEPVPAPAVWFGHSRWTENFPNEKPPSTSSLSRPLPLLLACIELGEYFTQGCRLSSGCYTFLGMTRGVQLLENSECIHILVLKAFRCFTHMLLLGLNYFKVIFLSGQEGFISKAIVYWGATAHVTHWLRNSCVHIA